MRIKIYTTILFMGLFLSVQAQQKTQLHKPKPKANKSVSLERVQQDTMIAQFQRGLIFVANGVSQPFHLEINGTRKWVTLTSGGELLFNGKLPEANTMDGGIHRRFVIRNELGELVINLTGLPFDSALSFGSLQVIKQQVFLLLKYPDQSSYQQLSGVGYDVPDLRLNQIWLMESWMGQALGSNQRNVLELNVYRSSFLAESHCGSKEGRIWHANGNMRLFLKSVQAACTDTLSKAQEALFTEGLLYRFNEGKLELYGLNRLMATFKRID